LGKNPAVAGTEKAGAAGVVSEWAAQVRAATRKNHYIALGPTPDEYRLGAERTGPAFPIADNHAFLNCPYRKISQQSHLTPDFPPPWLQCRGKAEEKDR